MVVIYSIFKSMKIRKLQKKLASTSGANPKNDRLKQMLDGFSERNEALSDYLDFCVSDKQIEFVMEHYEVSRSDLERIYHRLALHGLAIWIKGHYVAASSIAYAETLTFLIAAERIENSEDRIADFEMSEILMDYWNGDIPAGGLYKMLGLTS